MPFATITILNGSTTTIQQVELDENWSSDELRLGSIPASATVLIDVHDDDRSPAGS